MECTLTTVSERQQNCRPETSRDNSRSSKEDGNRCAITKDGSRVREEQDCSLKDAGDGGLCEVYQELGRGSKSQHHQAWGGK